MGVFTVRGRPLQGSGWSKYTLLKCSEGMVPHPHPAQIYPAALWLQMHSLHLFDSLPGPLINTLL